jgi:hypothetical protein
MTQAAGRAAPGVGRVIILTGPPGAGKTTVARLLTDRLAPSVHLHADDFWRFIRRGWVAPYLPQARRQNQTVIDVLAHAAFGYALGGYQVVCDGIVGPWFIEAFRAAGRQTVEAAGSGVGGASSGPTKAAAAGAADAPAIELHYVILRPDADTTMDRATGRGTGELTEPEPITSLHRQFSDLGELERHVLDSSRINPQTTAGVVLRGLARGIFLLDPG